jgi:hypothetical protein
MTDATDRARALLEAATQEVPTRDENGNWREHHVIGEESAARVFAMFQIREKAPATLAVAVTLAEFAQAEHDDSWQGQEHSCEDDGGPYLDSCKALAEWEGLMPEGPGA